MATTFPDLLSVLPFILADYILQVWPDTKDCINTLRLVCKDMRRTTLSSVTSFSMDLKVDNGEQAGFISSSTHPNHLSLVMSAFPDRMGPILTALGKHITSGINTMEITSNASGMGPAEIQQLDSATEHAMSQLVPAVAGLKQLSLNGQALFANPIVSSLSTLTQLTQLTLSNRPYTLAPHLKPLILGLQACSKLQKLNVFFTQSYVPGLTEPCSLPPSVVEFHMNGQVGLKLIANGFLNQLTSLTVEDLCSPYNQINELVKFAPKLRKVTILDGQAIFCRLRATTGLPTGFEIYCPSITLFGTVASVRDTLDCVVLDRISHLTIEFTCTGAALQLDTECVDMFVDKLASLVHLTIVIGDTSGDRISEGAYTGGGAFLNSLAGCAGLFYLELRFTLPACTACGLCDIFSSLRALKSFQCVPSFFLSYNSVVQEMAVRGRTVNITLDEM